ncbi:MAG: hypothetical protein LUH12_01010, partial [Bacteroides sp.]|nr:hypothetical protein [Bacteroides sp.]
MDDKIYNTTLLLKSSAANYPILKANGLGAPKAVVLVVEENYGKIVRDTMLDDRLSVQLDEFMTKKEVAELLAGTNSGFAVFHYSFSVKAKAFYELLVAAALKGSFMGREINCLILIISEGIPLGVDLSGAFLIFLDENFKRSEITIWDVVPADKLVAVVNDKMVALITNFGSMKNFLLSAVCFLYPILREKGEEGRFEELLMLPDYLIQVDDGSKAMSEIDEQFIDTLTDWGEKENFSDAYELPDIGFFAEKNLDKVILYNFDYIYMCTELFRKICAPLLQNVSLTVLKLALVEAEILRKENENCYPVFVYYHTLTGDLPSKKRMLRFHRKRLKRLGEEDF